MAYTVASSFDQFFEAINLAGDHRETANTRRDDVVKRLSNDFDILESFGAGSIPRYTALKAHADVDIVVVLNYPKHIKDKTPKELLQSVRDSLSQYRSNVRKNGQAVTLHYKTWPNVDIVPVARVIDGGVFQYFEVPDMNSGTWIKSDPKKHSSEVDTRASTCGINLRRVIKMLKHWNKGHSDYLQSYHIEVMALKTFTSSMSDISYDMYKFFEGCYNLTASNLWNNWGYADQYLSATDRDEARKRLKGAMEKALLAWHDGFHGKHRESIERWRQIFGDKFPAYG